MSYRYENDLRLKGTGASYIRVSTDQQDTDRQHSSVRSFQKRYSVTIAHQFEDRNWARDTAAKRPDFQRLMKMVDDGQVQWIVVDSLDRFRTKSAKQLMHFLYTLEEAGCKLYDSTGKEWTELRRHNRDNRIVGR